MVQIPEFTDDGYIYANDGDNYNMQSLVVYPGDSPTIYSCAATEVMLSTHYVMEYALSLVDELVRSNNLFQPDLVNFTHHDFVDTRMQPVLQDVYVITNGVQLLSNETITTELYGYTLTTVVRSNASIKPFRPLDGPMLMGDSLQMVQRFSQFPLILGLLNITRTPVEDIVELSPIGTLYLGLDTFKGVWSGQSASVVKLRERTFVEGNGLGYSLYDRYEQYEDWYLDFDMNAPENVSTYAGTMVANGQDPTNYECHSAFVDAVTRAIWVSIQQAISMATFIQYQGVVSNTESQNLQGGEIVENSAGQRIRVPFQANTVNPDTHGASWPIIPILSSMRRSFWEQDIFNRIIGGVNQSLPQFTSVTDGRVNFPDHRDCYVGWDDWVGVQVMSAQFYERAYPMIANITKYWIKNAPTFHDEMNAAVTPLIVHPYFFTGSRTYMFLPGIELSTGAPIAWHHSPVQIALTKLSAHQFPSRDAVRQLETMQRCFDTMEVRYLNMSVRCYTEYQAQTIYREEKQSAALKTLLSTNWALGVVLNIMGAYAAFRFLHSLYRVYKQTGMEDIHLALAMNMVIMGPDAIQLSELALLAASNLPLLLGYHLPSNPDFVDETSQSN